MIVSIEHTESNKINKNIKFRKTSLALFQLLIYFLFPRYKFYHKSATHVKNKH